MAAVRRSKRAYEPEKRRQKTRASVQIAKRSAERAAGKRVGS